MSDVVVRVENLSKKFCRSLKKGVLYTASDISADVVGVKRNVDTLRPGEFWVTKDLSFEMRRGESLGLLGVNGAGKSTLLKMLNGIIRPDKGRIRMKGRIGALIEVGAGFHPMLSGRENIYVNGAILGMSKREIDRKLDSIIDFSGLDSSILDAPVKTYSSGMYVRLGFAVAIHCEPDILLVDEILSVGDGAFRVRCTQHIAKYLNDGGTLLLVSHDLATIRETCDRVLLIEGGHSRYLGETLTGLQQYQAIMAKRVLARSEHSTGEKAANKKRAVQFTSLYLSDSPSNKPVTEINHGQPYSIQVGVEANEAVSGAHLHLTFSDKSSTVICGWTSRTDFPSGLQLSPGSHLFNVNIDEMSLVPGQYCVTSYISENNHLADYDDFVGPTFLVRTHPTIDHRFGSLMLKGNVYVA